MTHPTPRSFADNTDARRRSAPPEGAALIIGDWFVDEHWLVGVHRSSSSSRTGNAHYRALHANDNEVRAFCGTGRSAFFLHHVRDNVSSTALFPRLLGLGFWHGNDTMALAQLFRPSELSHSPYRLVDHPNNIGVGGVTLINLHDAFFATDPERRDREWFTNRIIRIYRRGKNDQVFYERFDWERPLRRVLWNSDKLRKLGDAIRTALGDTQVSVIVVKDLLKGAVTDQIISWLIEGPGRTARWYVSSKKWMPEWLHKLSDIDLRLLLVPQVAAQEALARESKLSYWLTRSGRPSKEGLDLIKRLECTTRPGNQRRDGRTIVILPGDHSVLCRSPGGENEAQCLVHGGGGVPRVQVPMGGASIFFPALTACLEYSPLEEGACSLERMLSHALTCTFDWVASEGKRVLDPDEWKADPSTWDRPPALLDISVLDQEPARFHPIDSRPWRVEAAEWEAARSGLGVVTTVGERQQLQLWRATVEVDGYVCCEEQKRESLRGLSRGIARFAVRRDSHEACMLIAEPGSGKTFLVNKLAQAAQLRFIPFNMTQLSSRSDILACFDTILATQAEDPDTPLLVFVDEINAQLGGASVYSAFLAPLEEGIYLRDGRSFHLDACMWVFAGTEHPGGLEGERSQKGSDFLSRLSMGTVSLNSGECSNHQDEVARRRELVLENVYLGASLLRKQFPDVRRVSDEVLTAFSMLPAGVRVRDIKHFVKRFADIQYGGVTAANVPEAWPGDTRGDTYWRWRRECRWPSRPVKPAEIAIVDSE